MNCNFEEALKLRRSYYVIGRDISVPDGVIKGILERALTYVPSAFNSQTTRLVLLLGKAHTCLWQMVKDVLREQISSDVFMKSARKIDTSFAAGYGSVLFWEDMAAVEALQAAYPLYADRFPVWAQHTSAMHQFVVWTMLERVGLGASLQHYNPLIDDRVRAEWQLPATWQLIAQMPFGKPLREPGEKEILPLDTRLKIFR